MLAKKVSNIHESTEYILSEIYRHGVILVRWVTRVPRVFDTILLTLPTHQHSLEPMTLLQTEGLRSTSAALYTELSFKSSPLHSLPFFFIWNSEVGKNVYV